MYQPFPHLRPRGGIYDLPPLTIEVTMRKLTLDYIKSLIVNAEYQRFGDTLTVCVLTLRNGFTVTGESACISKAIFDAEIGQKVAYDNAVDKIWQLEGYLTLQQVYEAGISDRLLSKETKNNPENIPPSQGLPPTLAINGIFITPKGYHLVTDKDYGDGFFIPLQQSGDRYIYARKAKKQPIDGEFIYATSAEEIAACEIKAEWTIATPESVYWDSAAFLHFWNAGRLVGIDVMLQGVFAQQAETFARLTGQEKE